MLRNPSRFNEDNAKPDTGHGLHEKGHEMSLISLYVLVSRSQGSSWRLDDAGRVNGDRGRDG